LRVGVVPLPEPSALEEEEEGTTRNSLLEPRRVVDDDDEAVAFDTASTSPSSQQQQRSRRRRWYGVTLDGRTVRTPRSRLPLAVPSEALAYAVAEEWNAQSSRSRGINPTQMPLTALACTAFDLGVLLQRKTPTPTSSTSSSSTAATASADLQRYRDSCLRFLGNDTTCYFCHPVEERALFQRQERYWTPLLERFESRFGSSGQLAKVRHDDGGGGGGIDSLIRTKATTASSGSSSGSSYSPYRLDHPAELVDACRDWIDRLDAWHLCCFYAIAAESKSFVLAWNLLTAASPSKDFVDDAVMASRLEEEYQIGNWGLVEGGHDYDRLNGSIQIRSAVLLKDLLAMDADNHFVVEEEEEEADTNGSL